VKPQRSFAEAYQVAESLCQSAKQIKRIDPSCGALDFHVLRDSIGWNLAKIRQPLTMSCADDGERLWLWAGPVVVPPDGVRQQSDAPASAWITAHHHERMAAAMDGLDPAAARAAPLSRAQLHELRESLFRGEAATERVRRRVVGWAPDGQDRQRVEAYLREHLLVAEPAVDGDVPVERGRFSRLISAMDLLDMAAGTARHRRDAAVVGSAR
jgi:hypothetical protein